MILWTLELMPFLMSPLYGKRREYLFCALVLVVGPPISHRIRIMQSLLFSLSPTRIWGSQNLPHHIILILDLRASKFDCTVCYSLHFAFVGSLMPFCHLWCGVLIYNECKTEKSFNWHRADNCIDGFTGEWL